MACLFMVHLRWFIELEYKLQLLEQEKHHLCYVNQCRS